LQLCGQIFEVLEQLLAEQEDETLQGLHVVAVTPAPDASNLLVSVSPGPGLNIVAAAEVLQRLEAATKDLRLEVASAITRRRVPGLLWRLV
jgi:ribosome-binding factor A